MWRDLFRQLRRSAWFILRIHWRRARYHYELAQQPPLFPVAERRFPIPPSQMYHYATAADEMFYRPMGQGYTRHVPGYPAMQSASATGVPVL